VFVYHERNGNIRWNVFTPFPPLFFIPLFFYWNIMPSFLQCHDTLPFCSQPLLLLSPPFPLSPPPPSQVTWTQLAEPLPADLKQACADLLASLDTTLAYDIQTLEEAEKELASGGEDRVLALRYRIGKKQLLAAAAGSTGSPVCMCVRYTIVGVPIT
jgi:hypothetical protein